MNIYAVNDMYKTISEIIACIDFDGISEDRKKLLGQLTTYVAKKLNSNEKVALNFICTHNSRRSQFSQLWAKVASVYYGFEVSCFSGGVEVTSCNLRTIDSLMRFGFVVHENGNDNPVYSVKWSEQEESMELYSKLIDSKVNPKEGFAAIMTCSHADENCPIVQGCEVRIPIRYEDPKKFDNTPLETFMYDYRSFEIAAEMFYVFSKVKE